MMFAYYYIIIAEEIGNEEDYDENRSKKIFQHRLFVAARESNLSSPGFIQVFIYERFFRIMATT